MSDSPALLSDTQDMMRARLAALDLLVFILDQKQALDHALDRTESFLALDGRDKGFVRMIVSTTLRRLGQIDDLITKAEHRSSTKPPLLDHILRIGITQIFFMAVPDHAAVDTSVRLAEEKGFSKQKGFVNGLLRTLLREGKDWLLKQDAGRLNTPTWLLKSWIDNYGLREAAEIANANLNEAALDITVRDQSALNHFQATFTADQIGASTLRVQNSGPIQAREGFEEGQWWVQDASAALPATLFGNIEGQTVYDLCAAPGGKTMQLAARGAHIVALDRSAKRLKRLYENLERVNLVDAVDIEVADAAAWKPAQPAHFILLDAPCSATGTIRRNPDVLHHKQPVDIERLISLQARILDNAFAQLAQGGTLIYCTCSLQKSEGEDQIRAFIKRTQTAVRVPISGNEIGGIDEAINEMGEVRMLPHIRSAQGGMDGFFIARLQKAA